MTRQEQYDLKLRGGTTVEGWVGTDWQDAVQSYQELHPGTLVLAWRQHTPPIVVGFPRIEE